MKKIIIITCILNISLVLQAINTDYRATLKDDGQTLQALVMLGHALQQQGNTDQAIALYHTALSMNGGYINVYPLLAECYEQQGNIDRAHIVHQKAVRKAPQHVPVLLAAGRFYVRQKKYDEGLKHAQQAKKLAPNNVDVYLLLGRLYNDQGKAEEAITHYRTATQIAPNSFHAHYNLGYALKIRGYLDEAEKELNRSLEIKPNDIGAHTGLAHAYWSHGKYKQAWEQFEYRWQAEDAKKNLRPQDLPYPMWDGISDLKGKNVLLYSEQGLGDTLQFVRFAQEIKKRGGRTVCAVQKPLRTLLKQCPYIDVVMTRENAEHIDLQAPLMSLPYLLKLESIPPQKPYLYADAQLIKQWKQELSKDNNFKIGICWEVDPVHDQMKSSPLEWRSVPLKSLAPLAQLKNVSFYSLQKVNGEDQINNIPKGFVVKTFGPDFDNSHGRFMDTAAVIANLDLIISPDSAIAHLAGGMDKPVWMMLPYAPECRWQFDRSDSDWYATMRIFRQTKPFDWDTVAQDMKKQLKTLIAQKK